MPEAIDSVLDGIGAWTDLPRGAVLVLVAIVAALVVGTIVRLTHLHRLPRDTARSLALRLRTWWIIALVTGLAVVLGRPATVALLCVVSMLALVEYLALVPQRAGLRRVEWWWVHGAAVLQYVWVYTARFDLFLIFVPVVVFLLLTVRIVFMRHPDGFMHAAGTLHWGMMICVFCISHVAFLLVLPDAPNPAGGAVGWFLYLVLLTELNDIAQALIGRPLGRHKIIPEVSPGKSWEGLVGGVVCTTVLAVLLAPVLTPLGTAPPRFAGAVADLPWWLSPWAAGIGVAIALAGFCGDIAISAVKRDARVKDSGTLLPGQGGILDRVDSLIFTAPLFFHAVHFLYYP